MSLYALSSKNLKGYLLRQGLVRRGEEIHVVELGGGVSNTVLMVQRASSPDEPWVVKQSLGKLRVKAEWLSDRDRILGEAEVIAALQGCLGSASLPRIIHVDPEAFLYVMTAAPTGSLTWKELLMRGEVDLCIAREAGGALARLIEAGRLNPRLHERFGDQTVFEQLRIDPYYRAAAKRHEDLRGAIDRLIADSSTIRTALVHGDFSPKNILVKDGRIFLIDFEVVHWGDPAFDAGFLLNHLFLKSFHKPQFAGRYAEAARAFWQSLVKQIGAVTVTPDFEPMTTRHLGALMLARIDGKSPVEYIREAAVKQRVRRLGRRILREQPENLDQALAMLAQSLPG